MSERKRIGEGRKIANSMSEGWLKGKKLIHVGMEGKMRGEQDNGTREWEEGKRI